MTPTISNAPACKPNQTFVHVLSRRVRVDATAYCLTGMCSAACTLLLAAQLLASHMLFKWRPVDSQNAHTHPPCRLTSFSFTAQAPAWETQ